MRAVLEYPNEMDMPEVIVEAGPTGQSQWHGNSISELRFEYPCPDCSKIHFAVFRFSRFRLHDDGTMKVFTFVGVE
jgi:hypothetical protein